MQALEDRIHEANNVFYGCKELPIVYANDIDKIKPLYYYNFCQFLETGEKKTYLWNIS
jgi:hypothetical protein